MEEKIIILNKNASLEEWIDQVVPQLEENGGTFNFGDKDDLYWAAKLAGEAGEYANQVCKQELTGKDTSEKQYDELGDVGFIWYLECRKKGYDPIQVIKDKVRKTAREKENVLLVDE